MKTAIESYLLPQYEHSEEFMDRDLEAIHRQGSPITRSKNSNRIKIVDGSELSADYLNYFIDHKKELEDEFFFELSEKIGECKTSLFCKIICKYWYDGKKKRESKIVNGIKKNIHDYLSLIKHNEDLSDIVVNSKINPYKIIFTHHDIASILTVNYLNVRKHLSNWADTHPNSTEISRDSIFFRRGLSCDSLFKRNQYYKEWDYINSYSIAFSAPEKFAQLNESKYPIIINGDSVYFEKKILFFSPFIRGMDVGQLELGIIPSEYAEILVYQGNHGGIHEYLIGDTINLSEVLLPY